MVASKGVGNPGEKESGHERGMTVPSLGCPEVALGGIRLVHLKGGTAGKEGEFGAGGMMFDGEEV
jgi:hypothetical protein